MTNPYTRDGDTDPQASPACLAAGYTDPNHKSLTSNLEATLEETLARVSDIFGTVCGTTALLAEAHKALLDHDPAERRFIMLLLIPVALGRSTLAARALVDTLGTNGGLGQ